MQSTVLLTGASGFLGRNLDAALRTAGYAVRPVSRHHGIDFGRMLQPSAWLPLLAGVDAVINCVGIIAESGAQRFVTLHEQAPAALFRACEQAGVRRVVQISALGADSKAFSAYHLSKRAADDCLHSCDLDWFVLRPALIYGHGGASARLFMRLATLPCIPVIGDGRQMLQPVHISDVVACALRCLDAPGAKLTLDIAGPERIGYAAWLQRMRRAQGLPPARLLRCPLWLALALTRPGRYFNPMLRADNLRMLQAGQAADIGALRNFLGRMPHAADSPLFFTDALTTRI
ncbi:NAD-dependent epimerase/dehydratase family protein [Massilia sp. erpn]|uniref:NAD-dependent epimerase/dehydratase family protein n=1 Tax=Massilia sp. erpn TaxID=2738142 RepID=UPI002103930E|nr:NAD-dependent epimerase/dehydratase family protein [Massilia sp. erpn]UTY56681.1 NAD(P)H-binding protein [Massilia sp. erpn]